MSRFVRGLNLRAEGCWPKQAPTGLPPPRSTRLPLPSCWRRDQRLYVQHLPADGGEPVAPQPLTAADSGLRFADGVVDAARNRCGCFASCVLPRPAARVLRPCRRHGCPALLAGWCALLRTTAGRGRPRPPWVLSTWRAAQSPPWCRAPTSTPRRAPAPTAPSERGPLAPPACCCSCCQASAAAVPSRLHKPAAPVPSFQAGLGVLAAPQHAVGRHRALGG